MNPRPRASLGRVLDDLGATLLELVHGDPDRPGDIGGVAIHDPVDEPVLPRHALVLGVGLRDPEEIVALLRALGRQEAAALVLREPVVPVGRGGGGGQGVRCRRARPDPWRLLGPGRRDAALAAGRG